MLEKIASQLLSYFLAQYVDEMNRDQLKIALLKGTVSLDNLSIKSSALAVHGLPFTVVKGLIKSIQISVPYTSLKSKPCVGQVDEILILGKVTGQVLMQSDDSTIKNYSELDSALTEGEVSKEDLMGGIVGTIIDNLKIKVTKVHIRIEQQHGDSCMAMGIIIPLISLTTLDENFKDVEMVSKSTEIRKKALIDGLSIYLDTNAKKINIEKFRDEMLASFTVKHQYILHNFTVQGILQHPKGAGAEFSNTFSIDTGSLRLNLDTLQWRAYREFEAEQARFQRKRFFASCGRPDREAKSPRSSQLWWIFTLNSASKKRHPISFDPQFALDFLKQRNTHLKRLSEILTKPNPKKDDKDLKNLEEKYGPQMLVLFRAYAKRKTEEQLRKEQTKAIKVDKKDVEELLSNKEEKLIGDAMLVKFKVTEIDANLAFDPNTKLVSLQLKSLDGNLVQRGTVMDMKANLGDFDISNTHIEPARTFFKFSHNEENKCASFTFHSDSSTKDSNVHFNAMAPEIVADMQVIKDISDFFSSSSDIVVNTGVPKPEKRDHTNVEIQHMFDTHTSMNLHLHLDSPKLIIPTPLPISILLGSIDMESIDTNIQRDLNDESTFYDHYKLAIKGVAIMMQDKYLCSPFGISGDLLQSFVQRKTLQMTKVSVQMDTVVMQITREQYLQCLSITDLFSDLGEPPQIEEVGLPQIGSNAPIVEKNESSGLSIAAKLVFAKFSFSLLDPSYEPASSFVMDGMSMSFSGLQDTMSADFMMNALSLETASHNKIIEYGTSDTLAIKAGFKKEGLHIYTNLNTAKPIIVADLPFIQSVLDFVQVPEKPQAPPVKMSRRRSSNVSSVSFVAKKLLDTKDMNDFKMQTIINEHPYLHIDASITAPIIIIPGKSSVTLSLGSFNIKTIDSPERDLKNNESLYDRFQMDMNDVSVKLGEEYLCKPISFNLSVAQAFIKRPNLIQTNVDFQMSQIDLVLKHQQFLDILEVADSFSSLGGDQPKQSPTPVPVKQRSRRSSKVSSIITQTDMNDIIETAKAISIMLKLNLGSVKVTLIDEICENMFVWGGLTVSTLLINDSKNVIVNIGSMLAYTNTDKTIISFGSSDKASVYAEISMKENNNFKVDISSPIINVDFEWINQIISFFDMPKKAIPPPQPIPQQQELTPVHRNAEPGFKPGVEPAAIPKFIGSLEMGSPVISMTLDGINGPQKMVFKFGSFGINMDGDKILVKLCQMNITLNERFLMNPLTCELHIELGDNMSISTNIPQIQLNLMQGDVELFQELGEYIPSKLTALNKPEPQAELPPPVESTDIVPLPLPLEEEPKPEEEEEEEHPQESNLKLDVKLGGLQLCILADNQPAVKLAVNETVVGINKGKINLALDSICIDDLISNSNLIHLDSLSVDLGSNIVVRISDNSVIALNSVPIQNMVCVFAPGDKILKYEKIQQVEKPKTKKPKQSSTNMGIKVLTKGLKIDYHWCLPEEERENAHSFFIDLDVGVKLGNMTVLSLNQLSANFSDIPRIFDNLNVDLGIYPDGLIKVQTKSALNDTKAKIVVNHEDINSILEMVKGLQGLMAGLDFSAFSKKDDAQPKVEEVKRIEKPPSQRIVLDIKEVEIYIMRDSSALLPLMLLRLCEISTTLKMDELSVIPLDFGPVDFYNTRSQTWNNLLEPFVLNFKFMISEEKTLIDLDFNPGSNESFSVNFYYLAIKDIIAFASNIGKPTKRVQYNTRVVNKVGKAIKYNINGAEEVFGAGEEKIYNKLDSLVAITPIGEYQIPVNELVYPRFLSKYIVAYRTQDEKGTLYHVSTLFVFENKTDVTLYLMRKLKMKSFAKVIKIKPNSTKAIPCVIDPFNKFAISDDKNMTRFKYSTFVFKDLRHSAIALDAYIHNHEVRVCLSPEVDLVNYVTTLSIEPHIIFSNQIPLPLSFQLKGWDGFTELKPSESVGTFDHYSDSQIFLHVQIADGPPSRRFKIKTSNGEVSKLKAIHMANGTVVTIAAEAIQNSAKPQCNIRFFVPAIIFNKTGLELHCFDQFKDPSIHSAFSPRVEDANPNDDGEMFWSLPSYFQKEIKLPLYVGWEGIDKICEYPIECSATMTDDILLIKRKKENIFLPLHYTVQSAQPFSNSSVITLNTQFEVENCLDKNIVLQPLFEENPIGKPMIIESGKHPIHKATQSFLFHFSIEGEDDKLVISMSSPVHTTFKLGERFIELEMASKGAQLISIFRYAVLPQPIMVTNDIDIPVTLIQDETDIPPYCTSYVAYENPFGSMDITLDVAGKKVDINLVQVNTPINYDDFYIEVVANKNKTKSITITREPIEKPPPYEMSISVHVPLLSLSLINSDYWEIALVTLQEVNVFYTNESIGFSLKELKVDDVHPLADLKVVAAGIPENEGENYIDFKVTMFPNTPFMTSCKELSFDMKPTILFADLAFINDMLYFVKSLTSAEDSSQIPPPVPLEASATRMRPFSAERFTIFPINLTLFVRGQTARPMMFPLATSFLKMVPDITNGEIELPAFEFQDATMNQDYIKSEIINPLIKAGTSQGLKLLFKTDIFCPSTGTKSSNFAKRGERLMNGEIQVIGQVGTSVVLQTTESVLQGASKLLRFASGNGGSSRVNRVNQTASDTMMSGVKSLGNSFKDGFTGLVNDPKQMAQEYGVGGAILGFGKGLVGLVTKPVAGLFDAGVGMMAGLRKYINNEDADVIFPVRYGRAFVDNEIRPFSQVERISAIQLAFQKDSPDDMTYNERIDLAFQDIMSNKYFCMTQRFIFIATVREDEEGNIDKIKINDRIKISKIIPNSVRIEGNTIYISVKSGLAHKRLSFVNDNVKALDKVSWFLACRSSALQIGK